MPIRSEGNRASGSAAEGWLVGTYSIRSPYTGEFAEFAVSSSEIQIVHDGHFKMHKSNELIETIIFACYENEELLQDSLLHQLISSVQPNQAESLQRLVDHFNSLAKAYFKRHGPYKESANIASTPSNRSSNRRSSSAGVEETEITRGGRATSFTFIPGVALRRVRHSRFLGHIMQLCYNRAIVDPNKLNKQKPFSTQTYGETMFPFVEHMVKNLYFEPIAANDMNSSSNAALNGVGSVYEFTGWRAKPVTAEDRFIDLGSGVGQVVLQLAASVAFQRPVVGIEKARVPQQYADNMAREFVNWMRFFARGYSPFALIGDDFLESAYADVIKRSTVVFANNFLFGPRVDLQLTQLFAELPEGARVVSSKRFCDELTKITERTVNDISAIMRVDTFDAFVGAVSWTSSAFSFYLQTIDRTRLERYYYAQRHGNQSTNFDFGDAVSPRVSELQSQIGAKSGSSTTSSRTECESALAVPPRLSRRRGNPKLRVGQTRVTRLIADDDDLQLGPLTAPIIAVESTAPPNVFKPLQRSVSTEEPQRSKRTQVFDAIRKRIFSGNCADKPGSSSEMLKPEDSSSCGKRRRKDEEDKIGTSSVLELFHAQADALTNLTTKPKKTRTRNLSSSSEADEGLYPSSIFNLPQYRESIKERSDCSIVKLGETERAPPTPSGSLLSALTYSSISIDSTPYRSLSRASSTSGVYSAANRHGNESDSELTSSIGQSSSSLFSLLRKQVDEQRSDNAAMAKKVEVVERFIANRRNKLDSLVADYKRLELTDAVEESEGGTAVQKILAHYSFRMQKVGEEDRRRSELRNRVESLRQSVGPAVQTSGSYTNVSPPESPMASNSTSASAADLASSSSSNNSRQPPVVYNNNLYPHYTSLCQAAPLTLASANRVSFMQQQRPAFHPASFMPAVAAGCNGASLSMRMPMYVDGSPQRFAMVTPTPNNGAQLPPTAFLSMMPAAHAHPHPNLNMPVYAALYANTPHAL